MYLISLNILYTTSKSDGVAKYGSKFISAEDFSYKHLNGAARVDCDHWHAAEIDMPSCSIIYECFSSVKLKYLHFISNCKFIDFY